MLVIHRRLPRQDDWDAELRLDHQARRHNRLSGFSADGEEVALLLECGQPALNDGDFLQAADGRVVRVVASAERLLQITCASPLELLRASYLLGSRHVALQLGDAWLRLPEDPMLRAQLELLGVRVEALEAPFQPDGGGLAGAGAQ